MSGSAERGAVRLSIVVPTRDEAANVAALVRGIERAIEADELLDLADAEVIFVDDSSDGTPQEVARVARSARLPVRCIHREDRVGGLGGAVIVGALQAGADLCLVMDADLQHPPDRIGALYARAARGDVDVVVASRYGAGGSAHGLGGALRRGASRASTTIVKTMFPSRLAGCTDPMTGFFLFDRRRVDLDGLRPLGFKILLEMLVRQRLAVAEVPFDFAPRHAGESKASLRQGLHFLRQLARLRFRGFRRATG